MHDNPFELIGRITVAWNRIELWWHMLFVVLLDAPRDQADALYLMTQNGRQQRQMVMTLAGLRFGDSPQDQNAARALSSLRALQSATDGEAGRRNAATHSRYIGGKGSPNLYVVQPFKQPTGPHDLTGKDVLDELTNTLARLEPLDKAAWIVLADVCTALNKPMP